MFDLECLYKSLIRHTQRTITAIRDKGISSDLAYYAWDSRGEVSEVDRHDLLGLAGWSFRENQGLWEVRSGLTLSTYNDQNLFREIKMLNIIHDMWGEGSKVAMLDADGKEFTEMVVSDFDMLPGGGGAELRNYRPVGIELLRTSS